ncbi:MAG TPA: 50S ribosomal protein L33 [Verrucomicrobiales bacterium]|jgi:large subunit ribosomal protein L33|nr:50S ribosomal protein L33 [Verrucomicrobiales bacterium]HAH99523.1 50S ribosomal protein L33 [Verrucomicrobiales bacterium]
MPRETVILECTEAKGEGKPVSRYMAQRNKKTQPERLEMKKYNPNLRRHTLHREIK